MAAGGAQVTASKPGAAADLQRHHLGSWLASEPSPVLEEQANLHDNPMATLWPHMIFTNADEMVLGHIIKHDARAFTRSQVVAAGCLRASSCRSIWWDPADVKAAVVTCGGLCPGLNSIIREITNSLWSNYGVRTIFGMEYGYNGLSDPERFKPKTLTPDYVREIHLKGGSILKAGRGGFDADKICDNFQRLGINVLFLIGGDGTQFAGNLLYEAARRRGLAISIIGIPKSIDNDVCFFDKTFGFETAVSAASEVIRSGWVEATSCVRGVGIVKLMGRDSGFVAVHAALGSTLVDLVLIPEVDFSLEDVCAHVDAVLERKGYMVIAVSEGAGQKFVETRQKDSTGHTRYGDIGTFVRDAVDAHIKPTGGRCFYIDPSYVIRSVPPTPSDHIFCSRLATDAVHTAMRGYTGVCVGPIHDVICMIPSGCVAIGKRRVNLRRSVWQHCVQNCQMPNSLAGMDSPLPQRARIA